MIFSLLILFLFSTLSACFTIFILILISFRIVLQLRRNSLYSETINSTKTISFFHPNCLSGGGGERVLWIGINSLLKNFQNIKIIVHTADELCFNSPLQALEMVSKRFGIHFDQPELICFSSIKHSAFLLRPECFPVLTLLGQFLGGLLCSLEALIRMPTDVIVDTTGCAAIIIPWKLFGQALVVSYVHYPTISTSMLERVANPSIDIYNNSDWIRESQIFTFLKIYYYKLYGAIYGLFGCFSDVTMTNSTWTQNHIKSLWGGNPSIVYPPCDTSEFSSVFELEDKPGLWIISIGQFRPEKDHKKQLAAFVRFLRAQDPKEMDSFKLIMVGGCRDSSDKHRVEELKLFADQLGVTNYVEFHINIDFTHLKRLMSHCTINLHTMLDEHFGISIVEGMAAGLITVAHCSGGPETDIIGPKRCLIEDHAKGVGFLCSSESEYATTLDHIFNRLKRTDLNLIRSAAKDRACEHFSNEIFEIRWNKEFSKILPLSKRD